MNSDPFIRETEFFHVLSLKCLKICLIWCFSFWNKSISCVKQFLIKYCDDRRREGYIVLQDPLSSFYEALCIGIDGFGNQDPGLFQGMEHICMCLWRLRAKHVTHIVPKMI